MRLLKIGLRVVARVVFIRTGGTDEDPRFGLLDATDVKACNGQNTIVADVKGNRAARTELQNRSLHLYLTMLSDALNDAGLTVMVVLTALFKSPNFAWSAYLVKERIWRPVQEQTLGEESTTKLETNHVSIIHDSINRATSDKLGVSVPFPDRYNQMIEQLGTK